MGHEYRRLQPLAPSKSFIQRNGGGNGQQGSLGLISGRVLTLDTVLDERRFIKRILKHQLQPRLKRTAPKSRVIERRRDALGMGVAVGVARRIWGSSISTILNFVGSSPQFLRLHDSHQFSLSPASPPSYRSSPTLYGKSRLSCMYAIIISQRIKLSWRVRGIWKRYIDYYKNPKNFLTCAAIPTRSFRAFSLALFKSSSFLFICSKLSFTFCS